MKFAFLVVLYFFCGLVLISHAQTISKAQDGFSNLLVPLDQPSATLESAKKWLEDAPGEIHPAKKMAPRFNILKSGRFVLYGNLFKTGGCFALAELGLKSEGEAGVGAVGFAEWIHGKWKFRGLWSIQTVWRPEGWKWDQTNGNDSLPLNPATGPFKLLDRWRRNTRSYTSW